MSNILLTFLRNLQGNLHMRVVSTSRSFLPCLYFWPCQRVILSTCVHYRCLWKIYNCLENLDQMFCCCNFIITSFLPQVFHKMLKWTKRYLMRQLCFLFTLRKGLIIVFGNATRSKCVKMHFHCTTYLVDLVTRFAIIFSSYKKW